MPRGPMGFGIGPQTEGVVVSPELEQELSNPGAAAAEYLREIRDRYVLPGGMQALPFNLAANVTVKFDLSQTRYNAFILTVTAGVAQVYFGDYSGLTGQTGNVPHYILSAAIAPQSQQIALPPGAYIITIQADSSGTCTGCLTPQAL